MQSQLHLWHFGVAADAHAGKNERPIIICHPIYRAALANKLMGRVNGNIIIAFAYIEFPVTIGVIAYSTDAATVERCPLAKQAAGVELPASVVAVTVIWIN